MFEFEKCSELKNCTNSKMFKLKKQIWKKLRTKKCTNLTNVKTKNGEFEFFSELKNVQSQKNVQN